MSDEKRALTPEEISGEAFPKLLPACPHCGTDPALIAGVITKIGGGYAVVFFCADPKCRCIHSVAPIPNPEPQATQPGTASGLWTPNGKM